MEHARRITDAEARQLLSLHRALEELQTQRPRLARVAECRFFAGMTIPEIGEALGVSPASVERDWKVARAWLNRELADQEPVASARLPGPPSQPSASAAR